MSLGKIKRSLLSDSPFRSVFLAAFCYVILFSAISIQKYRSFSFTDFDSAVNFQKYWNILHGEGKMSLIGDVAIWGNSLEVIAYPLSLVYFLFFSSPEAMLVLKTVIFGAAAIPIFLIIRKTLDDRLSACLAISYLLNPALWFMNMAEYYDMTFCLLTLSLAFYYLKKDNFRLFMLFTVLSLSLRADMALITFMFGVYALFDRKTLKWIAMPMMLSFLWAAIGILIIRPAVYPRVEYEAFYSNLGGNFAEAAKNAVSHPLFTLNTIFSSHNIVFMMQLLIPVSFLSLFGPGIFSIIFPTLLQHMISLKYAEHPIFLHYSAALLPFIYISAGAGLSRFLRKPNDARRRFVRMMPVILIILPLGANIWYGPLSKAGLYTGFFKYEDADAKREEYVRDIPADASVITTFEFTSHLANRKRLYSFHYVTRAPSPLPYAGYKLPDNIDYALIDFLDPQTMKYFYDRETDIRIKRFLEEGRWGIVDSFDNVVLFKKGQKGDQDLFRAGTPGLAQETPLAKAGDNLALLWYELKPQGEYLKMSFHWQCLEETDDDIWLVFQVFNGQGNLLSYKFKPMCYGIYPTYRWKKGEKVIDNYNMLLPQKLKDRRSLDVGVTLFSNSTGKRIPLSLMADGKDRGILLFRLE